MVLENSMHFKRARRESVLIIEDDLCLKTVLLAVLRKIDSKIECTWVTSAEDGLELLKHKKFDLIVCDHQLESKATGMDLWQTVHRDYSHTSFLLMSGMGVERYLKLTESLSQPPLYLPKPFMFSECQLFFKTLLKGGYHV